jgi:hypothetical protein
MEWTLLCNVDTLTSILYVMPSPSAYGVYALFQKKKNSDYLVVLYIFRQLLSWIWFGNSIDFGLVMFCMNCWSCFEDINEHNSKGMLHVLVLAWHE